MEDKPSLRDLLRIEDLEPPFDPGELPQDAADEEAKDQPSNLLTFVFTPELAVGDRIKSDRDGTYEVLEITSESTALLKKIGNRKKRRLQQEFTFGTISELEKLGVTVVEKNGVRAEVTRRVRATLWSKKRVIVAHVWWIKGVVS